MKRRSFATSLVFGMCLLGSTGGGGAATVDAYTPSLFVADGRHAIVERYPLHENVPQMPPAGRLDLTTIAAHVAVGPRGLLFVSYSVLPQVDVFASTATGHAKPLRSILFSVAPSDIAADQSGHLYAVDPVADVIDIFRPGAHGHAKPVAFVGSGLDTPIKHIAVDLQGRLFFENTDSNSPAVVEVARPLDNPVFVRTLFGSFGTMFGPVAIDDWHEMYVIAGNAVKAYSPSACCALYPADRELRPVSGQLIPIDIADRDRHAFILNSVGNSVDTYDLTLGAQTPISVLQDPRVPLPIAIASDR